VSYLEGFTAPMRDENQLHAAWSELSRSAKNPRSNIPTVQNWVSRRQDGKVGSIIFVTSAANALAEFPQDFVDAS